MLSSETIPPADGSAGWWASIIGAVAVLTGGGISALIKAWSDRRQGIEAHELSEDEARNSHWESILRSQVELLVEPMRTSVSDLQSQVAELRIQVQEANDREAKARQKYRSSIQHIRALTAWISQHMPGNTPAPPTLPADLAEDI